MFWANHGRTWGPLTRKHDFGHFKSTTHRQQPRLGGFLATTAWRRRTLKLSAGSGTLPERLGIGAHDHTLLYVSCFSLSLIPRKLVALFGKFSSYWANLSDYRERKLFDLWRIRKISRYAPLAGKLSWLRLYGPRGSDLRWVGNKTRRSTLLCYTVDFLPLEKSLGSCLGLNFREVG